MRNWTNDLAALLVANSSGSLVLGTNLFIGEIGETASLDSMATLLYPSGGGLDSEAVSHRPGLQITQRCKSYATAWAEAWRVYEYFLANPGPTRLGASPYTLMQGIKAVQTPFSIGRDETQSWRIVCNYELELLAQ